MVHFILESRDRGTWCFSGGIEALNIHHAIDTVSLMVPPEIDPADWRLKPTTAAKLNAIIEEMANDPRN
jgi:hypothetical protein